jgi:hypothetical protein
MRPLALVPFLLLVACGAPPPSAGMVRAPVRPRAERSTDSDADRARACVARASNAPFAHFTAPVANAGFRSHLAGRVAELRCCFTDERRVDLEGAPVRVTFAPRTDDPADGAAATLAAPLDPRRPVEASCLRAIVSKWTMTPAPVSDVVRVPLDPRISTRTSAASLSIVYPL